MKFFDGIFNLVFPKRCLLCNKSPEGGTAENICPVCIDKIPFIKESVCPRCGIPFKFSYTLEDNPDYLCGNCRNTLPLFHKALSACRYSGIMKEILIAYKYQNKPHMGSDLVSIMLKFQAEKILKLSPELIIAVPLHIKRLRERGYDQSYILADGIGRYLNIPVSCGNLIRTLHTAPQVDLTGEERLKNVKGAFSILDSSELKDRAILLIDDVFTTGATIRECTKIIRGAAAAKVYVLTIARA